MSVDPELFGSPAMVAYCQRLDGEVAMHKQSIRIRGDDVAALEAEVAALKKELAEAAWLVQFATQCLHCDPRECTDPGGWHKRRDALLARRWGKPTSSAWTSARAYRRSARCRGSSLRERRGQESGNRRTRRVCQL